MIDCCGSVHLIQGGPDTGMPTTPDKPCYVSPPVMSATETLKCLPGKNQTCSCTV